MTASRLTHPLRRALWPVAGAAALLIAAAGAAQAQGQPPAHGAHHAAMHRMHPGMGMPMIPERMLDAVGASAEQKGKLREIFQAAGDDVRAQRESGRSLHEQMARLMAAPQVDATAAEALRQKQLAVHDAVSKRMLQARLDAQAVLTPEQRGKLAERMAARQERMQHRMERHEHRAPRAPETPKG